MFDAISAAELLKVLTRETATVDLNDGTGSPVKETVCRGFGEWHSAILVVADGTMWPSMNSPCGY